MSPDASLHDFLGAQNARRRSRPGSPEWSSGPPEWSEDCARSGRGSGPSSFNIEPHRVQRNRYGGGERCDEIRQCG